MSSTQTCLYPIADALQLTLYIDKGVAKAHLQKEINVGPWYMKADVMVQSHYYDSEESAALVKLRKDLWAYFKYDRKQAVLIMALFKKPEGLKTLEMEKFLELPDAIDRIVKNTRAVFTSKEQEGWQHAEIGDLDQRLRRQGVPAVAAGAGG